MRIRLIVVQGQGLPQPLDIDAPSMAAARQRAQAQGYAVLSGSAVGGASLRLLPSWLPQQADKAPGGAHANNAWNLSVFTEQLRDLLQAGLSVIEALETLQRGSPSPVISALVQQLRDGHPLSAAMAADPTFPPLLVALVRASELTSDLPQSLSRFIDHEQRVAELRHRITSTALYPLLLIGVGSLVLLFLLFYVMPRFARIFEGMNGELPWSARAMVGWANLLGQNQSTVLLAVVALVGLIAVALGIPALRTRLQNRLLQWGPMRFIREPLTTYHLTRWYRATGMLVQGGIPLPQALGLANALLPASLQAQGKAVEHAIHQGQSPSNAHTQAGMATPVAEQLLRAAERTGDLGAVLERIAHFHENDVSRRLERSMKVLEPVVMLGIGLGVGLVVVLMYMPIFELASSIQ
jgi:general secretion pathway protein F